MRLIDINVIVTRSLGRSFLPNELGKLVVTQEAGVTTNGFRHLADVIHTEMLSQEIKRANLPVQTDSY